MKRKKGGEMSGDISRNPMEIEVQGIIWFLCGLTSEVGAWAGAEARSIKAEATFAALATKIKASSEPLAKVYFQTLKIY